MGALVRTRARAERPAAALAWLAGVWLAGCATTPRSPESIERAQPSAAVDDAGEPADSASPSGDDGARPTSARTDVGSIDRPDVALEDEPPYPPGGRHRPKSAVAASSEDDDVARWNRGGPDVDASPYEKPPHPAPRVKLDVLDVHGRIDPAEVQRVARSKGYWPFRLCYEDGLRKAPKLRGKIKFRVSVGPGGAPRGVRKVAADLDDAGVVGCVLRAAKGVALAAPQRGAPDVTFELSFWPGDAPIAAASTPPSTSAGPGPAASEGALVAALRQAWPDVKACFADGLSRHPGLWGRLALRLRVAAAGQVFDTAEIESHFPDREVVECVRRAYARAELPPASEERIFVYPLRLGHAPDR